MTDIDTPHLRELAIVFRNLGKQAAGTLTDYHLCEEYAYEAAEVCDAKSSELDRLKADLAVRDENYATLLKRWKEATQDLAIFRAENQRLKDLTGD